MSLPIKAVDRLFDRLEATYGLDWARQWSTVPVADVKTVWAHELAGFASRLDALAWALENLPERCPNVIQFRNLCRQAPAAEAPRLPEPKADPARIAAELAKLGHVRTTPVVEHGNTQWAHRIIGRINAGERVNRTTALFAKQALRMA